MHVNEGEQRERAGILPRREGESFLFVFEDELSLLLSLYAPQQEQQEGRQMVKIRRSTTNFPDCVLYRFN